MSYRPFSNQIGDPEPLKGRQYIGIIIPTEDFKELGRWYNFGISQVVVAAIIHHQKPIEYYQTLANQWIAGIQYNLGEMYKIGFAVKQNDAEAVKWYKKAAEQNYVEAQFKLGLIYKLGKGEIKQDYQEAVKWLRKAAAQNHPNAKLALERVEAQLLTTK